MDEEIRPRHIVIGQQVDTTKIVLARQMRRNMTLTETMLWDRLGHSRMAVNFRRQQIIDGFIADFYCHSAALVVEVDGPIHDPEYDAERDFIFAKRGIHVMRFTNDEVLQRIGLVLSRIRREIDARKI